MASVGFAVWPPDVRATCAELLLCPSLRFAVSSTADGRSPCAWARPQLNQQGAWLVESPSAPFVVSCTGRRQVDPRHAHGQGLC